MKELHPTIGDKWDGLPLTAGVIAGMVSVRQCMGPAGTDVISSFEIR